MTLPTELEVLGDVVGRLDRSGLPYMLTGSLALGYYAEPRMTRDVDLVVALKLQDAETVAAAFAGDYYVPDDLPGAIAAESFFNLLHLATVTKVDIVVRKNTTYRLQEFQRRRRITVAGQSIWIVSKEDLMLSKLLWAKESRSEVQLRDIRSLAASGYDLEYVQHWIAHLGLDDVWTEARGA